MKILAMLLAVMMAGAPRAAELTAEESAWLKVHPVVRIGTYDRDAPYAIIDPDSGAISGIAPDYVKMMFEKLGLDIKVEWKFYSGKQIALKALKNGEIDLINPFYCGEAEAEENGVVISKNVFGSSMSVLYRGEFTDRTMSVIASPYTRLGTSYVRDNYPDAKIVRCLHAYDCIDHLLKGEATSVVMYTGALRAAAETYSEEFSIKSLNSLCSVAFATLPENAAAIGIIDKGISFVDKVALNRLETKYFIADSTKVSAGKFFRSHPGYIFTATVFFFVIAIVVIVLVMQRRVAQKTSAAKTAFLFSMSHDIRSPMNAILGFADIAVKKVKGLKGKVNREDVVVVSEIESCLGKAQKAGNLLLSLINSILDMSRIGSGKASVEEVEMDVGESFSEVESTLGELAHAKEIAISFEYGRITDRQVFADRARLERIFMNLASNAIKYTKNGGRVRVKCEQTGERSSSGTAVYRYTFEDNGIGMSEDFQKHVFDQFAREQSTTASGVQGTGLGLALCKAFVELMGGTIECRSKQGVGTTFTVELPLRVREADAGENEELRIKNEKWRNDQLSSKEADHDHSSSFIHHSSFSGKRILLVEDNELNREVATYVLKEQGLEVESAEDGSIAVRLVREKPAGYFDCILMDIQMPIMGGYEATRAIRANEELRMKNDSSLKRIPIIALSANAFAEDRAASIAAGMDDHVSKPIKVKELMAVLAKFT